MKMGPSPHLEQPKAKEAVGCGLGLQRGGGHFTRRWKCKCLVNKHLSSGPAETLGPRLDPDL